MGEAKKKKDAQAEYEGPVAGRMMKSIDYGYRDWKKSPLGQKYRTLRTVVQSATPQELFDLRLKAAFVAGANFVVTEMAEAKMRRDAEEPSRIIQPGIVLPGR